MINPPILCQGILHAGGLIIYNLAAQSGARSAYVA